jgi:hypothetical protein
MSVRRAQLEIGSEEFAEWMAYAELEPFGPIRDDERFGTVTALMANVNRDSKVRSEPFTAADFFPPHPIDAATIAEFRQSEPADLSAKLTAWAAVMSDNGSVGKRSELKPKGK